VVKVIAFIGCLFFVILVSKACTPTPKVLTKEQAEQQRAFDYCVDTLVRAGEGMVKTADTCSRLRPPP
jgi:hypothetical protein